MGRVTSDRRAVSPVGSVAVFALLASIATISFASVGVAGPLDLTEGVAAPRPGPSSIPEQEQLARPRPAGVQKVQTPAKATSDVPTAAARFQIAAAEVINVRVRGQSEVNGDYRISPDMTISMPRLGRVAVGTMTAEELERHLADRLSASLRLDVSVAIEVVRFRPFFMTGQVAQPGSVEWRPDMTLIQAISVSGGVMRPGGSTDLDTPERRLVLEQAKVRHSFAVAQLARLGAEKARKESVEVEQILGSYIAKAMPESREALEAFLVRQNQLLEEQRAAHEIRVTGLARERDAVLLELEAARLQSDEVKLQVELTDAHMEGIESLKSQQLLTNSRYLEHRRALAEIKVRYSESMQLVQRARARYNALEREILMVRSERDALLSERIETLEREIAELELTLGGSGGLMNASAGALAPSLTYHIARKSSEGVRTMVADLFTEILPGDVVIVSSKQRARSAAPDGLMTTMTNAPDALAETQRIMESAVSLGATATAPSARGAPGPSAARRYEYERPSSVSTSRPGFGGPIRSSGR